MSENKFEFKVEDIVEAYGVKGKVVRVKEGTLYPIEVLFEDQNYEWFRSDGKSYVWHKEPSLKLVERPKKKVKKYYERWVNVYPLCVDSTYYHSEEEANRQAQSNRITCFKVTGEYEVEET